MTRHHRFFPFLRAATALALVLGAAFATRAYAEDALLGSPEEQIILQSARSARYADPHETPLAQATAEARARAARFASNTSEMALSRDLVGEHGMQDDINREIYRPGADLGVGGG